mgnify:CR=1 FL=1
MVKFIRFTKSITAPGVSPYPFSAKYAPAMNTPSWANMAVIAPIMPTIVTIRSRPNFSFSSARLLRAKSSNISFSALKLFTTEKPARQSLRAAVKSRLQIEKHHYKRTEKRDRLCYKRKLLGKVVHLHAGGIVSQCGNIRRRAFIAEGGYVLVYKRSESKVLILFLIRTGSRLLSARQRCSYTSMC